MPTPAIAAIAHIEHIETHRPWSVQVIKNCDADVFIVLNLLSSPAL